MSVGQAEGLRWVTIFVRDESDTSSNQLKTVEQVTDMEGSKEEGEICVLMVATLSIK